jgi:hypothetical protein
MMTAALGQPIDFIPDFHSTSCLKERAPKNRFGLRRKNIRRVQEILQSLRLPQDDGNVSRGVE